MAMIRTGLELLDALQYLRYLRGKKANTVCPAQRQDLAREIQEVRAEIADRTGCPWDEATIHGLERAFRTLVQGPGRGQTLLGREAGLIVDSRR